MFKKILVCADGSEGSEAAARAAAAIANHFGSNVLVVDVFHAPFTDYAYTNAWVIAIDYDCIERCAEEQRQEIEEKIKPIFDAQKISCEFLHYDGHPVDGILRASETELVDLIVMGCRGMNGIKELLLGSVSSGVLHHAHCPVLIIRNTDETGRDIQFQNLLVATDGSEAALKAAEAAVEFAQGFATSLTVLHSNTGLESGSMANFAYAPVEAVGSIQDFHQLNDKVTDDIARIARKKGVFCSFNATTGRPDQAIVHYAAEHHCDLIVLGSRGLGGFERMLLGSVSNYVAHHADCAVLIVR